MARIRSVVATSMVLIGLAAGPPAAAAGKASSYVPGEVLTTTLAKAERLAPFTILQPSFLPKGMRLKKVTVDYPARPKLPKEVEVTLYYFGSSGPGVLLLEQLGHRPPGHYAKLNGVPYTSQQAPKGVAAPNGLTLYLGNTVDSFTAILPMATLKKMAASMHSAREGTG